MGFKIKKVMFFIFKGSVFYSFNKVIKVLIHEV